MVVWLIGLSGSGKTTIGRRLQALLDSPAAKWMLLDGDAFREVMGPDAGHTLEERRKNAYRISRMCRLLELQGVNVIACVLSLFQDNRDFNRAVFAEYREVYIKVGLMKLERRDNKGLYAAARSGSRTSSRPYRCCTPTGSRRSAELGRQQRALSTSRFGPSETRRRLGRGACFVSSRTWSRPR